MAMADIDPVSPTEEDVVLAKAAVPRFRRVIHPGRSVILAERQGKPEDTIEIPRGALPLIQSLLAALASGHAVAVVPFHAELTTQQAADFLGVSRPFVVGLIEQGKLNALMVGSHRRIRFKDLVEYKQITMQARKRVLGELTQEAQENGEY